MANAGRILIIPKGAYNAGTTYEMLDLVKYDGISWLCKKTCTGVTPADGDYWQSMTDKVTKGDIDLGNVDNTSDADKPISEATLQALDELSEDISSLNGSLANYLPLSGGTLNGTLNSENIYPTVADSCVVGSLDKPFANVRSNRFYLIKNSKPYGSLEVATVGTSSTVGISILTVGNNIAKGTAGNAVGGIRIHGESSGYTHLKTANNTTGNNTIALPSANGTLALTSDTVASSNKLLATGDSALNHKHLYLGAGSASSYIRSRNSASEIGFNLNIDGTNFEGLLMQGTSANSMQMFAGADNTCNLGLGSYRWKAVYAGSGVITTSDRTKKTNIVDLDAEHAKSFVMGLKPSTYKFVDGTSDRTHYGLVAQDVEELMETLDMDSKDFAGFIKSPRQELVEVESENGEKTSELRDVEGEYDYSLRYDEFISPTIAVVQDHETRLAKLEAENEQLKAEISAMKSAFEALKAEIATMQVGA